MRARLSRSLRVITGVVVLAGTAGRVTATSAQNAVPDWAQQRTEQWYLAFNTGDAAALTNLHTADAVLLLPGLIFQGRTAIEAFHRANFERTRFSCTWTIGGFNAVDKLSVVWGDDHCIETPRAGGEPQIWNGRWMTVYQLQPDGSWMIVRDSGEEDRPQRPRPAV